MDLDYVKVNDKSYKIYQLINNKRENIVLNFENISSPFGLEIYQNLYYINWELDSDCKNIINIIEQKIIVYIKQFNNSLIFKSNIREKSKLLPLFKTRVLQKNKKFIVDSNNSLFEIDYKSNLKVDICLDSLWLYNNTFGLLWIINSITV
jgi:hypothetical protein